MIKRRTNWAKRTIAAVMTACMVLTTPGLARAENVTSEEYMTQETANSDVEAVENTADTTEEYTGSSEADTTEADTDEPGTEITEEDTTEEGITGEDTTEEDTTEDITEENTTEEDTAEDTTEEVTSEDITELPDSEQDAPDSQQSAELADADAPSLTLEAAASMSSSMLSVSEQGIQVKDGTGLILLSNVTPADYKDKVINLVTTSGWDVTKSVTVDGKEYSFLGLGSSDVPFEGTFKIDASTASNQYSISTNRTLFNALSTKAVLGKLSISISEEYHTIEGALLSTVLKADAAEDGQSTLNSDIVLREGGTGSISEAIVGGGMIGIMESGTSANITFENTLTCELRISGTDNVGLFCNTMEAGASLAAEYKKTAVGGSVSIETTGTDKNAGGFVGYMNTGTNLIVAGASVNEVRSKAGNVGGIVGSVIDGSLTVKQADGVTSTPGFTFADTLILYAGDKSAFANQKSAGGLIGYYEISEDGGPIEFDLSRYTFEKFEVNCDNATEGTAFVGGLFGSLINKCSAGRNISISSAAANTINTTLQTKVDDLGGMIGQYTAASKGSTLAIKGSADTSKKINVVTDGAGKINSNYGGIIAEIDNNAYVEIDDVYASTANIGSNSGSAFGGLIGIIKNGFLNAGNVTLTSETDISADNVNGRGGLVGCIEKGVLRPHGTTDLSGQKITAAYNHTGQIVGKNENGLIYAVGDGNALAADGSGWSLIRYNGADRGGSDIGNWGAVVRLGGNLTEGETGVLSLDQDTHTVTIHSGTGAAIKDANGFAAYALAFDISSEYSGSNGVLKFDGEVNKNQTQTVTLSGDVDLTGTGIVGIGKDSETQMFKGAFYGGNHKITLDIGTAYGKGESDNAIAAGQMYAKRSDQRDAHYSLAMIPFSENVTVSDVIIDGKINCSISKNVSQTTDERWPAFVSSVLGLASGTTTLENVTVSTAISVTEESKAQNFNIWQSGFVGRCQGTTLDVTNCTWGSSSSLSDERDKDEHRIGGLAAEVMGGCTVTVKDSILSGTINSKSTQNALVGGMIAVSRGGTEGNINDKSSTIKISNVKVDGEKINTEATSTSGGLLGYKWQKTNVVFETVENTGGVTISGSTLTAENAQFGGLVYQASGYWNATARDSIVFKKDSDSKGNTFIGKSDKDNTSGLLVGTGIVKFTQNKKEITNAMYLEVGTWGTGSDSSYKINKDAVTIDIDSSEYFDELVGITEDDDTGSTNAVVSLAVRDSSGNAERIDKTENNTYKGQIKNYKNMHVRYYYNLDSYRKNNTDDLSLDNISTPENLVLWSVSQYAAENIGTYFRKSPTNTTTITGDIDLTGCSYYPVTPLCEVKIGDGSSDTILIFGYESMNALEKDNKLLSDTEHQHHLMQHGLLYNVVQNVTVNKLAMKGSVGKETDNSGALIFGSVKGDTTTKTVVVTLKEVTLSGIRVADIQESDTYAPLLINRMEQAVRLAVDTLSTGDGYTSGSETIYAATSLIGYVGSATATKLTLSFSNIALDGRVSADLKNSTSVYNNGKVPVEYHTNHTIFTRATLLESFMYSSSGSGSYNFNSDDSMVTYGVELTNSGTVGRNPDMQCQYYDADVYITDELNNTTADEAYVKNRYKDTVFLRYIHSQQNITTGNYELDINQRSSGLLEGCGTYGDPYIIKDALQLTSLAAYIQSAGSVSKFQVVFNSKVIENQSQTEASYHVQGGATGDASGTDDVYTWESGTWTSGAAKTIDKDIATKYLLNAYYKINTDITLSAEKFSGLGTSTEPFSGVIVGDSLAVTISFKGTNANKDSFAGLIAYSRGSVVKDLTVDFTNATITMQADKLPGIEKNPFFGGVVGYCMGGDTIIDHVSVNYGSRSVAFEGTYDYTVAAGGYVGLVGGATHVTENSDYEKTGGGVVFRNMSGTTNSFTAACADAAEANKTVNMTDVDSAHKAGQSTTDGGEYFYRNPYVGRVLDGYACAEGYTVDNTDKNYTIPTLTKGANNLQVTDNGIDLDVKVTSAQGLWLLSAIVNSGAGAMDSTGNYTDVDKNQVVDAYQYGKPRTASYEGIGTAEGDASAKLADEAYWGGNASVGSDAAKNRVSYLVKNYTTGIVAARLAGKSSAETNIPVNLTFDAENVDMTSYGNGFRGIGGSYGENKNVWSSDCSIKKVYRRNILVKSINAQRTTNTTIKLKMNQNDYKAEYKDGSWINQGAGLFVDFHFTESCEVKYLNISGNVKVGLFDGNNLVCTITRKPDTKTGAGSFAARTANSKGKVTFDQFKLEDMDVYGGYMTGGAIGFIDGWNTQNARNICFKNWSIKNVNVLKWVENDGSAGGLVGWNIGYGKLEIEGDGTEDIVKNLKVTTISDTYKYAAAGGLVGACDYSNVSIHNVNVDNLIVTGTWLRDAGGLIAGGRNGNGKSVTVTDCKISNITVMNNQSNTNERCTGGIIGYHNTKLIISGVKLDKKSIISGRQYTGGFVGYSGGSVEIKDCKIDETDIYSSSNNWVGGFVGCFYTDATAVFKNCQEKNVNILGRYVGGLTGSNRGNIQASNVEFIGIRVATKYADASNSAGLLTGFTKENCNVVVSGYNILASSCKVGYVKVYNVESLTPTVKFELKPKTGLWVGDNQATSKINLVAVSTDGDIFPQKDVGTDKGTTNIVYADAPADTSYKPSETTGTLYTSANPWMDVNPKSDVPFSDGTVMTGNAVGTGTPVSILEELNSSSPASDYYWNLTDNKTELMKFLDQNSDAYLTTYKAEESATTTVSENVDFPVLVVNNTGDVDTTIWNYIAAMTNVNAGTKARSQVKNVTAKTYQWNANDSSFALQTKASLSVSTAKKISITPNAYDNQNSQFTLLDVTYENPTDKSKVFHLYIPVLVKKVLYIDFDAKFLAGTDYCAADYPAKGQEGHYATAGFGEPLTAYMEYNYDKDTDWQSMLDNGENLLWYYDKQLNLAEGSSADVGTLLPAGTKLTLVDRQTTQYYTYTTGAVENVHSFDLSKLTAPDGSSTFSPVYICDLLGLKAELAGTGDADSTYYVVESDKTKATIRIGGTYYRKAEDKDADEKYKITADSDLTKKGCSESYYLTVQIPETENVPVINNRLNYAAVTRKDGALPAAIKSDSKKSGSSYVIYNGVQQTLTVSTNRVHSGSDMADTVMENGDGIKIKLDSKLKLTEAGKGRFDKLGPSEFYHQFDIGLKEYIQNSSGSETIIGTENVKYVYTVSKGNMTIYTVSGSIQNAAALENLSIQYGSAELKKELDTAVDDASAVTVTAEVVLTYDTADKFPVRNTSDGSDVSGISPVLTSRIANTGTQLPIATGGNKVTKDDTKRYYTANQTKAMLTYTTVDETGVGDTTQQLGINPSDEDNVVDMICTRADYDYTNVDAEILGRAKTISYKLELFQKDASGAYDESKPLAIGTYMQDGGIIKGDAGNEQKIAASGNYCTWTENFSPAAEKHQFTRIRFAPITGEEFENAGYAYSNYRVRLTVVLVDEKGAEIPGTKTSDYIIYTNARIYQDLIEQ